MPKRIRIQDSSGGNTQLAEVPGDVPLEKLLPALITKLNLPLVGPEGRPIDYHLYYQDHPVQPEKTLDLAGVLDDSTVTCVFR